MVPISKARRYRGESYQMPKKLKNRYSSSHEVVHCQDEMPDDTVFLRLKNQPAIYGRFSSTKQKRKAISSVKKGIKNHLYQHDNSLDPLYVAKDEYIVSFTTSPRRGKYIAQTVASLLRQNPPPKAIFLNLPVSFLRDGTYFEQIDVDPRVLASKKVRINWVRDMGPLTKCLGLLEPGSPLAHDSSGILIYCDDDHKYKPGWAHSLIQSHREAEAVTGRNNAVTCLTGLRFDSKGRWTSLGNGSSAKFPPIPENKSLVQVMAPEGFMGVAIGIQLLFELTELKHKLLARSIPKSVMLGDDLMMGNELARLKKRVFIPLTSRKNNAFIDSFDYGMSQDALHQGANGAATDQAIIDSTMRYTQGWNALSEMDYNFLKNDFLEEIKAKNVSTTNSSTIILGVLLLIFIVYVVVSMIRR